MNANNIITQIKFEVYILKDIFSHQKSNINKTFFEK